MATKQFYLKQTVKKTETDETGNLTCWGLLKYMQDASFWQMYSQKPSSIDLLNQGKALMISSLDMKIYGQAKVGDELLLTSWPCANKRATMLRMYQAYLNGKLIGESSSKWILVDFNTRKILRPDFMVNDTGYYFGDFYEVIGEARFRFPAEAEAGLKLDGFKVVTADDCDNNCHMNNIASLRTISAYLPKTEGNFVKQVRLHFANEILQDEKLIIKSVRKDGKTILFRTERNDGEINIEAEIGF